MKRLFLFFACLVLIDGMAQQNPTNDELAATEYFTFNNNYWMNLHHFLYEQASHRQEEHLREDGQVFIDNGDREKISGLSEEDRGILESGVAFYKDQLIDQPLLSSRRILKWLQSLGTYQAITDTSFTPAFTYILNQVSPVYQRIFWEAHQLQNENLLKEYLKLIRKTEVEVIGKMEGFSGSEWDKVVRVDIITYGNWAGAYSPDFDNVVVSSIDPQMHSSLFVEFVYHESSHLLFLRKSPFRMALFEKSKELELNYPRNLWHAAMFYLSGLATQESLESRGIQHELIMKVKHVFSSYYENDIFRAALDRFYKGDIGLEQMASDLLLSLEK